MLTQISDKHPGGKCLVLDYGTKKHKRVNRSTFAAELNAAMDTLDIATIVQFTLEEIFYPESSSPEAMRKIHDEATLHFPLELAIDARSVFDAVSAPEFTTPSEATLINHLHCLREATRDGRVSALWWIDTRDMVADGLNKGGLPRDPILAVCEQGSWILNESAVKFSK